MIFYLILPFLYAVSESLDELVSAVSYRLGMENEKARINLLVREELCCTYTRCYKYSNM